MKLRTALLAATVLALPAAVMAQTMPAAQPVSGPYVSLGAGVNIMPDEHTSSVTTPVLGGGTYTAPLNGNINMRDGFVGQVSGGYGLGNGLRVEVEGDYYDNNYQSQGQTRFNGKEKKYGGMANALYDFIIPNFPVEPYLGVGVGYQWANAKNAGFAQNTAAGPVSGAFGGTEGSFAYQGIAGVAFPIPAIPGLALTAEYRFMGLAENRNYGGTLTVPAGVLGGGLPGGTRSVTYKLNHDYNNSFLVGLRFAFNAAPPPPPPAPAPAPVPASVTRNYLVFFDWDRADLTDRARQIIAEAAANSRKVQVTRIQVNGYTDTSGTARYNLGLSNRRAASVKSELIKDGVPAGEIMTMGYGETHLLVPTGPGVREPQNRRVEIILQ